MKRAEIEARVLSIAERVRMKQPIEDSLIELKASWIEPKPAARRIAASCNAARGDLVLYVIGIDEERGIPGVPKEELANWWPRVQAEFDQQVPTLVHDVVVPIGDRTVVALLLDSSGAPFVVRNPVRGTPGCGPIELEVPWREGNATRSARREDLMRILVPVSRLPEIELLGAHAACIADDDGGWRSTFALEFYVVPRSPIVLIAHRSTVKVLPEQLSPQVGLSKGGLRFERERVEGVSVSEADAALNRPAQVRLTAFGPMTGIGPILPPELTIEVALRMADGSTIPSVTARMSQIARDSSRVRYQLRQ